MTRSSIYTGRIGEESDSTFQGPLRPLTRPAMIGRWVAVVPCSLVVYTVAYYMIWLMGMGAWEKACQAGLKISSTPALFYQLLFHAIASSFAGYMTVSLGALEAPSSRGKVGAGLFFALLVADLFYGIWSITHGQISSYVFVLCGVPVNLIAGGYAVRNLAGVFGWTGRPALPAGAYWKYKIKSNA